MCRCFGAIPAVCSNHKILAESVVKNLIFVAKYRYRVLDRDAVDRLRLLFRCMGKTIMSTEWSAIHRGGHLEARSAIWFFGSDCLGALFESEMDEFIDQFLEGDAAGFPGSGSLGVSVHRC